MTQLFDLKIVSPSKLEFDASASMVEIPGREGDFGVLKNHAPLVSTLRPGVIKVHLSQSGVKRYFVTSGYAEVSQTGTTILSDHIQEVDYINANEAREALASAQKAHEEATELSDKMKTRRRLEAAEALVAAVHAA